MPRFCFRLFAGIALAGLALGSSCAAGALRDRFPDLVQADSPQGSPAPPPADGVRITWLGTNGYLFEARSATVLVDPYFSRMSLWRSTLPLPAIHETARVDRWLASVPRIDGVLVTHGHVDHLFDVPQILRRRPGTALYAAATAIRLARSTGVPSRQLRVVKPGDAMRIGSARVRVLPASHDRVLVKVPFDGPPRRLPPVTVSDWVCGETIAFLVEIGGKRLYLAAGSMPEDRPPAGLGHIDLAIQGLATPDAVRAFPAVLERLRPAAVLPSHMDDFFRPLDRGFSFLPMTDFPRVRRIAAEHRCPLILLDYFQPWTLR